MRSLIPFWVILVLITGLVSSCGNRPQKPPAATSERAETTAAQPAPEEEKADSQAPAAKTTVSSPGTPDTALPWWRTQTPRLPPGAKWRRNTPVQEGPNVDLSQLPKELVYPNAKVLGRYGDYTFPGLGPSYNFVTNDPLEAVESHFKKSMSNWTTLKEIHQGDTIVWVMYESKDKKEVAEYIARRLPDRTSLVIMHCRR